MTTNELRHIWETESPEATRALGEVLGRSLVGGLAVGLTGQLGAGKTLLVKGIAAGNAVEDAEAVTSPTFTLIHEYPGRFTLHHVDVYRLKTVDELVSLGFDELLEPGAVVVVEWADRVREAMPEDTLWVDLAATGQRSRRLSFSAAGPSAIRCLTDFRSRCG